MTTLFVDGCEVFNFRNQDLFQFYKNDPLRFFNSFFFYEIFWEI